MAVIYVTGFEARQAATDALTYTGTAAYSTAQARTGAASIRCNPASGASGYVTPTIGANPAFLHFGVYIATLPTVTRRIAGVNTHDLRLTSTGTLEVYVSGSLVGTSSALSTGTWYWIGFRMFATAGTPAPLLQIDGTTAVSGERTSSYSYVVGPDGTEASAIDLYIDDIIADDAGFLAPSKVDLALPISDNARTAVVTGDGAGTTNLWDAVDATPPAGVASASETATTNIEYPASATESYTANLETYTTLGVVTGDTLLAVRSVIRHGEDINTGTKNGVLGAVSNPTISDALGFVFGTDGGAHGAESGANFWVTKFGTLTTSPSVTLGTSPTLIVSRVSETRVGCVDFMGLLVAWTPAAARVPHTSPYPQLLAH